MFLLCQILLKVWSRYCSEILGSCFKNSYGISSGPGVVLWDFLTFLVLSWL